MWKLFDHHTKLASIISDDEAKDILNSVEENGQDLVSKESEGARRYDVHNFDGVVLSLTQHDDIEFLVRDLIVDINTYIIMDEELCLK